MELELAPYPVNLEILDPPLQLILTEVVSNDDQCQVKLGQIGPIKINIGPPTLSLFFNSCDKRQCPTGKCLFSSTRGIQIETSTSSVPVTTIVILNIARCHGIEKVTLKSTVMLCRRSSYITRNTIIRTSLHI